MLAKSWRELANGSGATSSHQTGGSRQLALGLRGYACDLEVLSEGQRGLCRR